LSVGRTFPGAAAPAPTRVTFGTLSRYVLATPIQMPFQGSFANSSASNSPSANTFDKDIFTFTAPFGTSEVAVLVCGASLGTGGGEVMPNSGSNALVQRRQIWEWTGSVAIGSNLGTRFQFAHTAAVGTAMNLAAPTNEPVVLGLQAIMSRPLAFAVAAGDVLCIRSGTIKPQITEFVSDAQIQKSGTRNPNDFPNTQRTVVNSSDWVINETSLPTDTPEGGNAIFAPAVLFKTTDPLRRCVCHEGTSSSVGFDDAKMAGYFDPRGSNGARTHVEYACYLGGMQFYKLGEGGSNMFREFPQSNAALVSSVNEPRVDGFTVRKSIKQQIGFTDIVRTMFSNEYVNFGTSMEEKLAGWLEIVEQWVDENTSRKARSWIMLGHTQTTWTGGGTNWNAALTEAQFMDAQTPLFGLDQQNFRQNFLLPGLDRLAKRKGNLYVYDACQITHRLNTRGELVFRYIDGVRSTRDGLHGLHNTHHVTGVGFSPFFGSDMQSLSAFPAPGVLNPGAYL
jgi:hypothetical protein